MLLRSILRAKPHLRKCLVRCRQCRIFFFTDPRNAGRCDLRCPFGCREAHRRKESNRRSSAYYLGEQGRKYKKRQNQRQTEKRRLRAAAHDSEGGDGPGTPVKKDPSAEAETAAAVEQLSPGTAPSAPTLVELPPWDLVEYVRRVVSLIEGRPVSRAEILEVLRRVLRQRSMSRQRQIDHTFAWLNEHPP